MSRVSRGIGFALLVAFSAAACSDGPVSIPGDAVSSTSAPAEVSMTVNGSPGDRQAIQQIVDTFDATWAVDAAAYAAQYAHADWVGPNGANLNTATAILQLYTSIFPIFAGSTRQSTIRALTFLTGTVAVLDIDARVTGNFPPFIVPWQPNTIRALEKNVLVKRGGEWKIVQHQQTAVAPGVP
jgi:hypothetical protein